MLYRQYTVNTLELNNFIEVPPYVSQGSSMCVEGVKVLLNLSVPVFVYPENVQRIKKEKGRS